ncbi:Fungal fucose-specific lectin [Fusarium austroafricanum]|uniref:Fungal fucose-specific lectin n=1 Tax=Fusarium austroafricanum TaxID=2364996 RepID=A0A8H4KU33_9HYPO|nr:Fungal fucose-specific lectin [Fusarium austroafricanum]
MANYYPGTDLCSIVVNNHVYTYVQDINGALVEIGDKLVLINGTILATTSYSVVPPYDGTGVAEEAPKELTPLAVASFDHMPGKRYLFYVDKHHKIHDVLHQDNYWIHGTLSNIEIHCAANSRLAAIPDRHDIIYLHYQAPQRSGLGRKRPMGPHAGPAQRRVDAQLYCDGGK